MPIGYLKRTYQESERDRLVDALANEWKNPDESAEEPLIADEGGMHGQPRRLYVVWNDWSHLNMEERSEIVMDAYERVCGAEACLDVNVAMGLTREEAEKFGIDIEK